MDMRLDEALRVDRDTRLALVGSGGKSTALFQLAGLLTAPVLLSSTTHLAAGQLELADHVWIARNPDDFPAEVQPGRVLFIGGALREGRAPGLTMPTLARLRELADALHLPLLIEADGSRMRPLKAPADHEPALPAFANTVVVVAGLSALGQPLNADWVHRPRRFARLAGIEMGTRIQPAELSRILVHPHGGAKNIPDAARRILLLNQADDVSSQARAVGMVGSLLSGFDSVVIAALQQGRVHAAHERVAGIILAAGGSQRLGRPKQLLEWQGKPLVRHVTETALAAGLHQVIVVTGAFREPVLEALAGLAVEEAFNPEWEAGQSTSVKCGVRAVTGRAGAALFALVDQPWTSPPLIRALCQAHASALPSVVAPLIDGQRGNPVLFDRRTFPDFASLQGDQGARRLFSGYRLTWVPWHDERALLDIDTEKDYLALLQSERPG